MARRWIIRPLAESDLEHAARWYNDQGSGLGLRFLDAVDEVFGKIRVTPMQFPVISTDVRRALVNVFPYAVYFRVTDETAVVLAVLQAKGRPSSFRGTSRVIIATPLTVLASRPLQGPRDRLSANA